jgi:NAD(P)-dependent dehydrogenase (short-subunit alcohol dehydrogenase family)
MSTWNEDACAVVVGATGTLGGAIARKLIGRGLPVVAVGRDREKLDALAAESSLFRPCRADIADDASIETIKSALPGPVKMAVMSAGLPVRGSALTIEPGDLSRGANIKVDGLVRLLRAIDTGLGRGSRVAVLTGFLAIEPTPHEAAPGAINAAVHNLVRQMAELLGPRGTTVHAICPGPVDTERLRSIAKRISDERGITPEEAMAEYKAASSLGELISVDQVAWAANLLLDDEASCLHGSTLAITGGRLKAIF